MMSAPALSQPVVSVVPPVQPLSPPPSSSPSRAWWLVIGIFVVIFIGIAIWYFSTR